MAKDSISIEINLKEGQKITYLPLSDEVKEYFEKTFEKNHIYYLKQFLVTESNYELITEKFNKAMHDCLPLGIGDNCKYCKGNSEDVSDKNCNKYILQMEMTFIVGASEFIKIVLRHKHIYENKRELLQLTAKFYQCFIFLKGQGVMYFDLEKMCRETLNAGFKALSKLFESSEVLSNLNKINETLNELEAEDIENKTLNKEDENYLDLQIAFFKSKQRYYKEKIFLDNKISLSKKKRRAKAEKKISVIKYALYYHYLQVSGDFPFFENHPNGKLSAIEELIKEEKVNTTPKYFQIQYNLISNHNTNRIAKNQVSNISFVANHMLTDFPKAKKIAIEELKQAQTKNK